MYPGSYAEATELSERRYLVATLLYDAWLPRALVADLDLAEQKAIYWSEIYGAPRTRISEVWVPTQRPKMRHPPQAAFVAQTAPLPAPPVRPPQRFHWAQALAKLDRPFDPTYAKGLIDGFLLYVGTQIALRVLEMLKSSGIGLA
ncbi:MAG: hypothetical protein ING44_11865 [Telmatospirillum sp.]|nr:hypothetical protein [Telmatospirillum sp.]